MCLFKFQFIINFIMDTDNKENIDSNHHLEQILFDFNELENFNNENIQIDDHEIALYMVELIDSLIMNMMDMIKR